MSGALFHGVNMGEIMLIDVDGILVNCENQLPEFEYFAKKLVKTN